MTVLVPGRRYDVGLGNFERLFRGRGHDAHRGHPDQDRPAAFRGGRAVHRAGRPGRHGDTGLPGPGAVGPAVVTCAAHHARPPEKRSPLICVEATGLVISQ